MTFGTASIVAFDSLVAMLATTIFVFHEKLVL
jgi:hypothetical protein